MPDTDEKSIMVAGSPCTVPWCYISYSSLVTQAADSEPKTEDYSSYGRRDRESGKTFAYLLVLLAGLAK